MPYIDGIGGGGSGFLGVREGDGARDDETGRFDEGMGGMTGCGEGIGGMTGGSPLMSSEGYV